MAHPKRKTSKSKKECDGVITRFMTNLQASVHIAEKRSFLIVSAPNVGIITDGPC